MPAFGASVVLGRAGGAEGTAGPAGADRGSSPPMRSKDGAAALAICGAGGFGAEAVLCEDARSSLTFCCTTFNGWSNGISPRQAPIYKGCLPHHHRRLHRVWKGRACLHPSPTA